ncbi:SDR family NAD(P)-dependent oxidoreductase [Streptomyces sp. NPDC057877]|uniref:SDR family NAD(P)-dependent oxidoreductase n=1 Tax=Streptomyces sp. NPDC057877 TaxID=3346269 RepID=UPI0036D0F1B7
MGTARDLATVDKALAEYGDRLLALALDVTDGSQARAAVAAATERFGAIDVLVNNAGRGLLGAVEEASDAEARAVYDTNVFGLLNVSRAVLPVMR